MSEQPFNLDIYSAERIRRINEALDRYTPAEQTDPEILHKAMRYSLLAGGKRIRPLLCIAAAEAVGGTAEQVLPTACALEMIHTFSLIHDDLPAMDDDDLRRGLPTSHKVFGEAMAILAGDALHTLAFSTLATFQESPDPLRVVRVIGMIADASGSRGMCGGQVDDIAHEGKAVTPEELRHIHARKTGALLHVSLLSGAILAGATLEHEVMLTRYGQHIGVAFQIVDDILDVVGDDAAIGKKTGSDANKDKATYPKLFGLDESRRLARESVHAALDALKPLDDAAAPLRGFAHFIVERNL
ncbi:MAG: polyprenyl synthetase family protein [Armatimonadaceae bacterium]